MAMIRPGRSEDDSVDNLGFECERHAHCSFTGITTVVRRIVENANVAQSCTCLLSCSVAVSLCPSPTLTTILFAAAPVLSTRNTAALVTAARATTTAVTTRLTTNIARVIDYVFPLRLLLIHVLLLHV